MIKRQSIIPLRGGFGNQLFCWAYGLNLQRNGHRILFDRGTGLGRGFALGGLVEPTQTVVLPGAIWRRMNSNDAVWRMLPGVGRIREDETRPPVLEVPSSLVTLHWGYWQSHDYFADATDEVGSLLTNWLNLDSIADLPTCGVHVRRGDYVNDAGAAATLGAQPLTYFARAMGRMNELGITKFVIYTDDRDWAAENLVSSNATLAPEGDALSDFIGLANSAAVVMSNSSFSWWAAYLASRKGAPIIGPAQWFNNGVTDASRLMRERWERV